MDTLTTAVGRLAHHDNSRGVEELVGFVVEGLGGEVDRRAELELGEEREARNLGNKWYGNERFENNEQGTAVA